MSIASDSLSSPDEQQPVEPQQDTPDGTAEATPTKEQSDSQKGSDEERPLFRPEDIKPNGGPLGCCMGTVAGLFLILFLTMGLSLLITNRPLLHSSILIPIIIVGALVCGFFGWRIGKRVYREYDPPVIKERPFRSKPRRKRA